MPTSSLIDPGAISHLRCVLLATTLTAAVVSIQATVIDYDQVQPFPETKATTQESKMALQFKPQLYISRGCNPYPAVDEEGNVSGGKGNRLLTGDTCAGSRYGSQVYGRSTVYKGTQIFMYAWYFPRAYSRRHSWEHAIIWLDEDNSTISAVSTSRSSPLFTHYTYAPPNSDELDGKSVQLRYWGNNQGHNLKTTWRSGQSQDLVMWSEMTEAAQNALATADFGWEWKRSSKVPFTDGNFETNLHNAYPW